MNKRVPAYLFGFAWSVLFFLIYIPAFVTHYGFCNDYGLVPVRFPDIYPEAPHLFIVGRCLGAFLVILKAWLVNSIAAMAGFRFFAFLLMLVVAGMFYFFLRRRIGLAPFWAQATVAGLMLLPASQVYVLYVLHLAPGFITLILALASYLVMDPALATSTAAAPLVKNRPVRLFGAGILFLGALLIYPPNALVVFACTGAWIVLSPAASGRAWFRIFCRDLMFFGSVMVVYYFLNLLVIFPNAPSWTDWYDIVFNRYNFVLARQVAPKLSLIKETFVISLAGFWHPWWRGRGAWISAGVPAFFAAWFVFQKIKAGQDWLRPAGTIVKKVSAVAFLFLAANAAIILPEGVNHVFAYRILFPSGALLVIVTFGILARCDLPGRQNLIIKGLVVVMVAVAFGLTARNVFDFTVNMKREIDYVQHHVRRVDFDDISNFVVVLLPEDKEETLIGRRMPFEFGYMVSQAKLFQTAIDEVARQKGHRPLPVKAALGPVVFTDPHSVVIDMNEAQRFYLGRRTSGQDRGLAIITTSASPDRRIEVLRERGLIFLFQEKRDARRAPFWEMDFDREPEAWFQFRFQQKPQTLQFFTFGALTQNIPGFAPIGTKVRASNDGTHWTDIATDIVYRQPNDKDFKVYRLRRPAPYRYYRFYLTPDNRQDRLRLTGIHMLINI